MSANFFDPGHVDFVEGCEHGRVLLSLQQTGGDSLPDPAHGLPRYLLIWAGSNLMGLSRLRDRNCRGSCGYGMLQIKNHVTFGYSASWSGAGDSGNIKVLFSHKSPD